MTVARQPSPEAFGERKKTGKICILNCYSGTNVGDRAMTLGCLKLLRKALPGWELTCHTPYPWKDLTRCRDMFEWYGDEKRVFRPALLPVSHLLPAEHSIARPIVFSYLLRALVLRFLCSLVGSNARFIIPNRHEKEALHDISTADLVVYNPGFLFDDSTGGLRGFINSLIRLYPLYLATVFKHKVVVLGVSMGPFYGTLSRWFLRSVLSDVSRIFVREPRSAGFVLGAGVESERVEVIPDLALSLVTTASAHFDDELHGGIKVAVIPRCPVAPKGKKLYQESMARLIEYLVENTGAHVFLVPHTRATGGWEANDEIVVREVRELAKQKDDVTVMPFANSPKDLIGFYRTMDMIISSRTHGIVLSRPVPVLAIPVVLRQRFEGLMQQLGLSDCISETFENLPQLRTLVDRICAERVSIRERQEKLIEKLPNEFELLSIKIRSLLLDRCIHAATQ